MKLLSWIIDHPVAVIMFYVVVLITGVVCSFLIPIELSPNIELPQLTISAGWPGTSPITVESQLTAPLESAVQRLRDVTKVVSRTQEGYCTISAEFKRGADLQLAELELNEQISQLKKRLPSGVSWPTIQRSVPEEMQAFEGFMRFQLIGEQNPAELRQIAEEKLYLPLSSIQGVEHVNIQGGEEKILHVELDPNAIQNYGIGQANISSLKNELSRAKINLGNLAGNHAITNAAFNPSFAGIDEILNIPVKRQDSGRMVMLSDLADVNWTHSEAQTIIRINGRDLVSISLNKEPGANLLKTERHVDQEINRLEKALPRGTEIVKEMDKSRDLRVELNKLRNRSFLSILFIALVLSLVFRNIKTALVILGSLFISVLGAICLFYLSGNTLNILTLAGFTMGFGILVDNAIVVYDNIHRQASKSTVSGSELRAADKEKWKSGAQHRDAVVAGVREMVQPLLASNLTTIGAFLPVFFLSPDLKIYFQPFAMALGSTVLISLFVSFTLIPIFVCYWMPLLHRSKKDTGEGYINKIYKRCLRFCMAHPVFTIFVVVWLFGFPIWLLPNKIDTEKKPQIVHKENDEQDANDRKSYELLFAAHDSSGVQQLKSGVQKADSESQSLGVASEPGLFVQKYNQLWGNEYFSKKIKPVLFKIFGGASYRFFRKVNKGEIWQPSTRTYILVSLEMPNGIHLSRINRLCQDFEVRLLEYGGKISKMTTNVYSKTYANIRVDIEKAYERSSFPMELYANLVKYGLNLGGVGVHVAGFGPGFYSGLGNTMAHYSVKVTGTNFNQVHDLAKVFAVELEKNKRVNNIDTEQAWRGARVQHELIAQVKPRQFISSHQDYRTVAYDIQSRMNSHVVHRTNMNEEEIGLSIGIRDAQGSLRDLSHSLVADQVNGHEYRLGYLVDFNKQRTLPVIQRENQTYMRLVSYDYIGPYHYGTKFRDAVIKKMDIPYGYAITPDTYHWFGGRKQQKELLWIILLALLIVLIISAALFESLSKPFLILLAIPLSVIGLFYAFYFFDATFDRGGYAAILLLVGIVVNNSIILVKHICDVAENTPSEDKRGLVIEAASHRIRPVMLTTATTIVGMLPLVLFESTETIWYALAVGGIGGLAVSSLLLLIVIPVVFGVIGIKPLPHESINKIDRGIK